jgi:hypothetical protein
LNEKFEQNLKIAWRYFLQPNLLASSLQLTVLEIIFSAVAVLARLCLLNLSEYLINACNMPRVGIAIC